VDIKRAERKEDMKEIKEGLKLKKTDKKLSPADSIKKAVKIAVLKGAEKDTIKGIKDGQEDKEPGYDHSELMSAIKGVSLTPAANGLNAAAAAGVDIAHQVLVKSSALNPAGVYVRLGKEA
jgi:hypothetical protein